jgi:squalene-hopene/tetraprenyl-beta-curcumene cyclase
LLALARFGHRFADSPSERTERSASMGVGWLIDLQNADGGWPAFSWAGNSKSRGESGNDATAFALRALAAWQTHWQAESGGGGSRSDVPRMRSIDSAIARGWRYLESQQREDGSFVPAWFGNEHHPRGENPVFGTAHVLLACADLCRLDHELAARAVRWLLAAQHASGGWGPPRAPLDYSGAYKDGFRAWRANDALAKFCSVEETALAVSALLPLAESSQGLARAVANGLSWLASAVEQDTHRQGAVIGLYFSRLWYHERLSPLVYAAGALTLATRQLEAQRQALAHIG